MIGVFDPKTGAAGDMVLGCLLDLVENKDEVLNEVMDFVGDFGEVDIDFSRKQSHGFLLGNLDVEVHSDSSFNFEEIKKLIYDSSLSKDVKEKSIGVFELINDAEENVHGERSHFHEVGQIDALVDVVGSSIAFNELGLEKIYSTPIYVGGGSVETQHGSLGVPSPATAEILKKSNLKWRGGPVDSELLTPTGAALLSYFVEESVNYFPELVSEEIARSSGSREIGRANYLSLIIGEREDELGCDQVSILETNVDDVDGEVIGYVKNKLLKNDALDVSVIPLHMKKDRSGYLLRVLCKKNKLNDLSKIMVKELGSLGVRVMPGVHRFLANREKITLSFLGHEADVKIGYLKSGEVIDFSAEFDDCKKIAEEENMALKEVRDQLEELARNSYGE